MTQIEGNIKNGYIENKIASQLAIILAKDSERGPSSIKKRLQGTGEVITHWHQTDFLLLSKPEQSREKLKQKTCFTYEDQNY